MASHVLRAPVVEADTGFAIRVLRDAVGYITASVRQLQGRELEDIFGGKTVFENILQYEEGKYPLEEMRHAAAYLLINQLLFYHVLSKMDAAFPALDEEKIRKPADLAQYFEPVLKRNYSSIFGFDVASRLPADATDVVKKTVMAVKALAPEKIRHDLLGKVFHELIPFDVRKSVAAFYTNNEAAEILAQLAIDKPDAKVMDLAVGSGTLLVAAYRRKRELLQKEKGTVELEDHKRFLEQDLTGIDIMPFAAHLAVVHLSLQALLYETEKVRVAVWDSTELKPGQTIPAVWSELKAAYRRPTLDMFAKGGFTEEAYVTKGAVTLQGVGGEKIPLEQADLIIMNPPFTRQERLPSEYKMALKKRFEEYEKYLHGQLGLYGYFIFLADRFVKEDGRIAFVLPATVLRVKSAKGVRQLLTQKYCIEHIITTWERAAFSEGAQFREILLVATKANPRSNVECCISSLKKLPSSIEEASEYAQKLKLIAKKSKVGELYMDKKIITVKFAQQELRKHADNLYLFVSTYDLKLPSLYEQITGRASERVIAFKKLLQQKNGGIFEFDYRPPFHGAFVVEPFRAIKNVDEWVLRRKDRTNVTIENRFTNQTLRVPLKAFIKGLRRPARTEIMEITNILDLIILEPINGIEWVMKHPSNLNKWKKYVTPRLANLVVSRRFDMSATGTRFIAYYSEEPMVGVDMWSIRGLSNDAAKILGLWLNSTLNLLALLIQRTETRGAWMKLHEYMLEELLILNPETLSEDDKMALLDVYNKVKDESFPSILEQLKTRFPLRVEIDKALLRVLGFGDDEISRIVDYLYPALANEIEQLKRLMEG
jgi:type I restriction-modification system DNA methylase subunit